MFTLTQTKTLPKILTFTEIKCYIFSLAFVSLAVFVPWLCHQFHLSGPKFLPMQFFIIIAGFLFGWRTGLLVGFLSPILSYSITHLPSIVILPEVILELTFYGLIIGILREKKANIWLALLGAMIFGRLARLLFVLVFGLTTNPLEYFLISLPGILLQLALIPFFVFLLQKFVLGRENEKRI